MTNDELYGLIKDAVGKIKAPIYKIEPTMHYDTVVTALFKIEIKRGLFGESRRWIKIFESTDRADCYAVLRRLTEPTVHYDEHGIRVSP